MSNCNFNSITKSILMGVHQRSHVAALLFLIHISQLQKCFKYSKADHFADDIKILQSGKSLVGLTKKFIALFQS